MEEINLEELFKYYLKKLPIIITVTVLTILLGFIYIKFFQVPMYHGTTTIILVQKNSSKNESAYNTQNELNINEKLVTTYSEIVKSRRVLKQVIDSLNLNEDVASLSQKIEVVAVSETSIIKITVSDENNEIAANIANKLASTFKTEITKIYNLENIATIDAAVVENKPYNVNVPKQTIIYTALGLIASCIIVFIMYYFDNTIKNKKEIEEKLNLPVLAEVPLVTKVITKSNNNKYRIDEEKFINVEDIDKPTNVFDDCPVVKIVTEDGKRESELTTSIDFTTYNNAREKKLTNSNKSKSRIEKDDD